MIGTNTNEKRAANPALLVIEGGSESLKVPIKDIEIGERRREDYGDVAGLAESIQRYGLIQPVVLDDDNRLVAGGRRLEAAKSLGWSEVDVRNMGELTDAELRKIEAEENRRRKDLTSYEWSKEMVRKAREAAETISSAALKKEPEVISSPPEEKDPRGRKSDYGVPKNDAAQAGGFSVGALVNAENHVAAVDRYPELKPFTQGDARKMARNLDKLPEPERDEKRALVKKNDSDTLSALTDRPPIPKGPTPKQMAKTDPGYLWSKALSSLYAQVNGVTDGGGLYALTQRWKPESRRYYLKEVRRLKTVLSSWEEILEAEDE